MYLLLNKRTTKIFVTAVAWTAGLSLFLVVSAPKASALSSTYPDGSTSRASVLATVGHNVSSSGYTTPAFYLWESDGHTYSHAANWEPSNPGVWAAQRGEGQLGDSTFEAITDGGNVNKSVEITIVGGCKPKSDPSGDGWEDHMYHSPDSANPFNGISLIVNGNPNPKASCSDKGDLVYPMNIGDWKGVDKKLGGNLHSATIMVQDNTPEDSEKVFQVQIDNGSYIAPADDATKGFTNIQNPAADYWYGDRDPHKLGNCDGGHPGNCPAENQFSGYSNLNVPADSSSNTYDFYFSPDCTSATTTVLKWRLGDGSDQSQGTGENWKLFAGGNPNPIAQLWDHQLDANQSGPIKFDKGVVYRWEWSGVDRAHGVSVQLPYSAATATGIFNPVTNCANKPPPKNIQGSVFELDRNGNRINMSGVVLVDCNGQFATTDGDGSYSFSEARGAHFCIRVFQPGPSGFVGPYDRPWGSNGQEAYLGCGPYGGTYVPPPNNCGGTKNSYEWQWAGKYVPGHGPGLSCTSGTTSGPNPKSCASEDKDGGSWDGGYDFVYTPDAPVGSIDTATCGPAGLNGWTFEPSSPGSSLQVDIYEGGPYGTGAFVGTFNADIYDAGVDALFNIPGNHAFHIDLSGFADGNPHRFFAYARGIDFYGHGDGDNPLLSPAEGIVMNACKPYNFNPTPSVRGNDEDPTTLVFADDTHFTLCNASVPGCSPSPPPSCIQSTEVWYEVYKINVGGGTTTYQPWTTDGGSRCVGEEPNKNLYTLADIPPGSVSAGDQFCMDVIVRPGSGWTDLGGTRVPGDPVGGDAGGHQCIIIHNAPYFKVFGNGVSAGGDFQSNGTGCSGGGTLGSWNNNSGTNPAWDFGASADFSALALNNIVGFGSAHTSTSRSPSDLSFANSGGPLLSTDSYSPSLGGNFGNVTCFTDWPKGKGSDTKTVAGPYTLSAADMTVSPGDNKSIFVNGDVYIPSNVLYVGDNGVSGGKGVTWNTKDDVPSFVLHATGNIYVDPNVNELDGLYISTGSGKHIYTCGQSNFTPVAAQNLYGCNKQLTIYGDFEADNVDLMRTLGSIRNEKPTAAASVSKNGSDIVPGGCSTSDNITYPCGTNGGAIYALVNYVAAYQLSNPAAADYTFTFNYSNNNTISHDWLGWPPPPTGSYKNDINIDVNGVRRISHWTVPVSGTPENPTEIATDSIDLGPLPANALIGIEWDNNDWIDVNGNPDPPGGTDFSYDPNLEIDSFSLSAPPGLITPLTCSNNGGGWITQQTCAAEVFDFSPELYLSTPGVEPPDDGTPQIQAITSLPPVL